MRLCC